MSEKQSRGIGDLSKYDTMTTEELEEILRLDAQAPEEQESDIEKILYIMEVLTERKAYRFCRRLPQTLREMRYR